MQSSLNNLLKFLRLEASRGYDDEAVIGGLIKILDFWIPEARNEKVPEEIIQDVSTCMNAYHVLDTERRSAALKDLWGRIQPDNNSEIEKKENSNGARQLPEPAIKPAPVTNTTSPEISKQATYKHPPRSASQPGGMTSKTPIALNASLTVLNGVGPRNAQNLEKLGLHTLEDMLYFFPRRYDDYSKLKPIHKLWYGEEVTVVGTIQNVTNRKVRSGKMNIIEVIIEDGTGALRLSWFNQPWLENRLKKGDTISVSGKVEQYLGRLVMSNPDWDPVEVESLHTNRIVPVYSLTSQVTQKALRKMIQQVVSYWAPKLTDHMPQSILTTADLPDLGTALMQAHFPDTQDQLNAARQRLAFDEIFFLQMGVYRQKRNWQQATARLYEVTDEWLDAWLAALPFALTGAQNRSVADIRSDLKSGTPMNRLLQGDVGSGKTVVAAIAATIINQAGAQATIMAPTSILAEQHFRNFSAICTRTIENGNYLKPDQVQLLVSDTSEKNKQEIRDALASGYIKVLIGTHALLEDPVFFKDLQLAVIDEQHRFGVEQRAILRSKGSNPHLLVMTATPIPRSLALTVYGDLDISVMDELPPGRMEINTHVLFPRERERAYAIIRSQVEAGHQAFIVYPLVEESEKSELRAAREEHERLQKDIFPKLKLGLLHGRLRPEEKDAVMLQFRNGDYHILVATTVVEVGVDIPNATVMLIEAANHFGLAQLHQLRGRVGRGDAQAFCLLIPDHEDAAENERLAAMTRTNDGFILAETDLKLRGPGDFLGTRQAGYANLRMASLTDVQMIEKARKQAQELFERDADLSLPENQLLAEALGRFWGAGKGDIS
ncbi:MAG: ATP-dependent DNA helicase RecG [Chloroflexi bacterium GWB2_49_20]|nr:MAG: ATP-dependent DNA helicase RecG [Chloroflexi bacterium GWB2_49_20]OGN79558.1 MAG: ATP-dependent DNA helicase RecG [Chloroflexi bacterium GWC2_49_37]OGN84519.1 MAG: ATP-dependent DNA helicase RecG [Chloroflexi bacterium GWD2_49_16]HBG74058.1 DNA helicase RecG [Anaerolineae bacterium]HCC78860.1 DNA helicase RecG [Anaerolineae bacterium]